MGRIRKEEINRKLLHILALGLPAFIFYGPDWFGLNRQNVAWILFGFFLFSLGIDFTRLYLGFFRSWFFKRFGSMMRAEEEKRLTGATYIVAGSFICSLISLSSEQFAASAFLSLTLFIIGDAMAALCGKAFGKIRIGNKTLEGALGCLFLCVIVTGLIFPLLPSFLVKWDGDFTWMHIFIYPIGISLLELFPIKLGRITLNDNLYVPAIISMMVLMR